MDKKTKLGPLLYISQPFTRPPANNMQEVFTSRQEVQLPIEEPEQGEESKRKKVFEVSLAKTEIPKEPKQNEVKQETPTQPTGEKHRPKFRKVKSFKEMNISERLEYLVNFPKAIPSVPCVFYTEEKNYQGYLVEYTNNDITIKFPNETTETIPVNQIKDILMIGLKN
jgi:Spore coat protein CotO